MVSRNFTTKVFRSTIPLIPDDDIDHLNEVDNRKLNEERKQKEEEMKELAEFRNRVAELQEHSADQRLSQIASKAKASATLSTKTSQRAILTSVVKRKSESANSSEPAEKRPFLQTPSAFKCVAVLPGVFEKSNCIGKCC